ITFLPVTLFLIILLWPSMITEGRVLTQNQKELSISADHNKNHKSDLDKIEFQGQPNIQKAVEMTICASDKDQTLLEDQANANQDKQLYKDSHLLCGRSLDHIVK
uniref:Uncharacterized protein n=1 Tax=Rattus norvegicus TaxID=10116 RepID=F1M9J5_RAT